MAQIIPSGNFNPAALSADDLYIVIQNPPAYIRGVPTDVVAMVGTASWGPTNTPVHMGSAQDGAQAFGPISAVSLTDPYDMATDVAIAFGQSTSQSSIEGWGVRVTDGTDVAATIGIPGGATVAAKLATLTGTVTAADTLTLTATSSALTGSPINVTITVPSSGAPTLTTLAGLLAAAINANAVLAAANVYASAVGAVVSLYSPTTLSPAITWTSSVAPGGATEIITLTTGSAGSTGATLTALYTGVLGNQVTMKIQAGSQTGSFTASITPFSGLAEVYPNISGTNFWQNLQQAVNKGISGVRGPSAICSIPSINPAVAAPTIATTTLAGGTDGRSGVTSATLLGNDTVFPKTGIYSLRGVNPAPGVAWLVGCTDTTVVSALDAFALSNGSSNIFPFPTGTNTATAVAAVQTAGIHDGATTWAKDWVYFFDQVNSVVRLVSPVAFIAGDWMTYDPSQSPGNKPVALVLGTDHNPPNVLAPPYSESEIGQLANAGITFITNPIPAGSIWGIREGQSTSLNPATAPMEWWRMTNYLARSFSGVLGQFVDQLQSQQPNDPLRQSVRAMLNDFLNGLEGAGQIDSFTVQCSFSASPSAKPGGGINTPASVAQHYLYALVQVRYLSSVRFFILTLQGGTTVVTVNGTGQQLAA